MGNFANVSIDYDFDNCIIVINFAVLKDVNRPLQRSLIYKPEVEFTEVPSVKLIKSKQTRLKICVLHNTTEQLILLGLQTAFLHFTPTWL